MANIDKRRKMKNLNKDYIIIKNEKFYIERENNLFYLVHPKWSLIGVGKTLHNAEINLIKEAKELFSVFKNISNKNLSNDGLELKKYLFELI